MTNLLKKTYTLILFSFLIIAGISGQNGTVPVKIMHYNVLRFGPSCNNVNVLDKYEWLEILLNYHQPDILTVNELGDNIQYSKGIKQLSFSHSTAIDYGEITNYNGSEIVNQIFFNTDLFGYLGVDTIKNAIRDINVYELFYKASATAVGSDTIFLHCIVTHLKAGNSDAATRNISAKSIMSWVAREGMGKNILLMGDMNIYSNTEAAFQTFVFNSNTDIRFSDPSGKQNGWAGQGNALAHTQSTRNSNIDCGSAGGLDDRFDMILTSSNLMDTTNAVHYIPATYSAFGNDGNTYNTGLNCATNNKVPTNICQTLVKMSDHLPVVMRLAFPDLSTSIPELSDIGIEVNIFPNPVSDQLFFDITKNEAKNGRLNWEVIDLTGRVVKMGEIRDASGMTTVPTNDLSNGMYQLKLTHSSGARLVHRFIKMNK